MPDRTIRHRSPARPAQAGFSLFEVLISLFVTSIVIVAALGLFDFNNRVTRVETQVAEMQQSLRMGQLELVRMTRMAGRGGLPGSATLQPWPGGLALAVANNVAANTHVGDDNSPLVVAGTDVITLRGVYSAPIYQLNYSDPLSFQLTPPPPSELDTGFLTINSVSPTGVAQSLDTLAEAIRLQRREALILVSPIDDAQYAIVELDPETSSVTVDSTQATIGFKVKDGSFTDEYAQLMPGATFPSAVRTVAFVAILEEYRFFVWDDDRELDRFNQPVPRLAKARFFPGTQTLHPGDGDGSVVEMADYLTDLQVSLGIDLNNDGFVPYLGTDADEWLFNSPDDDVNDPAWNTGGRLFNLRITTVARTLNPDPGYTAAPVSRVEDRLYSEGAVPGTEDERQERMYRRRTTTTVVDMRNLS